ncbi:uncharacterized protein AKAME5_001666500 [Lates japonicus]|uniref:Uncharacterized protein n=1 Tax=Lates japonicus TaxID=270547 RepID=A0AAD3N5B5_LATJO|nr:uncharacterized protein AKAME5_001666500 [Lates japonicus]
MYKALPHTKGHTLDLVCTTGTPPTNLHCSVPHPPGTPNLCSKFLDFFQAKVDSIHQQLLAPATGTPCTPQPQDVAAPDVCLPQRGFSSFMPVDASLLIDLTIHLTLLLLPTHTTPSLCPEPSTPRDTPENWHHCTTSWAETAIFPEALTSVRH